MHTERWECCEERQVGSNGMSNHVSLCDARACPDAQAIHISLIVTKLHSCSVCVLHACSSVAHSRQTLHSEKHCTCCLPDHQLLYHILCCIAQQYSSHHCTCSTPHLQCRPPGCQLTELDEVAAAEAISLPTAQHRQHIMAQVNCQLCCCGSSVTLFSWADSLCNLLCTWGGPRGS